MYANYSSFQYFCDADATRKAFRGGVFRTGDLAVMHSDGTIAVVDRSKDIIISGGEVYFCLWWWCSSYLTTLTQNASSLAIEQGEPKLI